MIQFILQNSNVIILLFITIATNTILNLYGFLKKKNNINDYPLDMYLKIGSNRLLGDSTTVIGLLLCLIVGIIMALGMGGYVFLIFTLCVYFGHMFGSFIKRRLNKKDGEFLFLVDHVDSILLVMLVSLMVNFSSLGQAFMGVIIIFIIQPFLTYLGYIIGLREKPL